MARRFISMVALTAALGFPAVVAAQGDPDSSARPAGIDTSGFDRSIRPQDDFYRYVNGSWLKRTQLPADRSAYGTFTELADDAESALRSIVESLAARRDLAPGSDEAKIAGVYRSFMDTARIEERGLEPLRGDLRRVASMERAELPATLAWLGRIGVQRPFSLYVGQDAKHSDRYTVYFSQSGLGLPDRDYYFKDGPDFARTRGAYVDYAARLFDLAGTPRPRTAANRVMALETRLAGSHWTRVKNRDRDLTYNAESVAELDGRLGGFDLRAYLDAAGIDVDTIVVRQPDYVDSVAAALADVPLETWRDYLTFKLLDDAAPLLSAPFRQARFDFRGRVLSGQQEERARWKRGVDAVSSTLGDALGRLYVEREFSPESKRRMQTLVGNLREAFRRGIDSLAWMSRATRREAHDKLAHFNVKIAYPDRWDDYSALEVRDGDLLGNMRRSSMVEYDRRVSKLGGPIDRDEWGMHPYTVNAYYSSTMNEIVFPAAILQPPFYDPNADDAVNYGAIGAVIGHEISHGFDDQGRKSDGAGNLRDWWTETDAEAFERRADALAAQYDEFSPISDMHVNGRMTLGENIGDLSGLKVAHDAYLISLGGRPAPEIAGLTGDQRFFMGWARIWRRLYRDEELRNRLMTDSHSPSEYRVNGVVRNMDAFVKAFGVKPGDELWLPPEERVEIW